MVCSADTIRVPTDQPTIQAGIDAAVNGDTVLVAPGTYFENIDRLGKAIYLRSDASAEVTVIDGNQVGSVVTCQSREEPSSVLCGFTLTNGKEDLSGKSGGMYNKYSKPTITHCIFLGNITRGIYNFKSSPTVIHCTFSSNSCGMWNDKSSPHVIYSTFNDTGPGIQSDDSHLTVTNCTFSNNMGGGIESWNGSISVTNSTFSRNYGWGGYGKMICRTNSTT
jgi:hypothetical protein